MVGGHAAPSAIASPVRFECPRDVYAFFDLPTEDGTSTLRAVAFLSGYPYRSREKIGESFRDEFDALLHANMLPSSPLYALQRVMKFAVRYKGGEDVPMVRVRFNCWMRELKERDLGRQFGDVCGAKEQRQRRGV